MINWKTRIKSKEFWAGIVGVVAAAAIQIGSLLGVDISDSVSVYAELAVTVATVALLGVGVVADPTTKGIGDSLRALGYTEPRDDSEEAEG